MLPAGGPGEAGAAFVSSSHASSQLTVSLQFFSSATTKLHESQKEKTLQLTRSLGGSAVALLA